MHISFWNVGLRGQFLSEECCRDVIIELPYKLVMAGASFRSVCVMVFMVSSLSIIIICFMFVEFGEFVL